MVQDTNILQIAYRKCMCRSHWSICLHMGRERPLLEQESELELQIWPWFEPWPFIGKACDPWPSSNIWFTSLVWAKASQWILRLGSFGNLDWTSLGFLRALMASVCVCCLHTIHLHFQPLLGFQAKCMFLGDLGLTLSRDSCICDQGFLWHFYVPFRTSVQCSSWTWLCLHDNPKLPSAWAREESKSPSLS